MYSLILNSHSSLNRFQSTRGIRNSCPLNSDKYNLTIKELYVLFIKNLTKNDITKISKFLSLDTNEYLHVVKDCLLIIKKVPFQDRLGYKEAFMERCLLHSCYSAIVLLKTYLDRRDEERDKLNIHQVKIVNTLLKIGNKISKKDKEFVGHLWHNRKSIKAYSWQIDRLMEMELMYLNK